jgi:hypothetical protein
MAREPLLSVCGPRPLLLLFRPLPGRRAQMASLLNRGRSPSARPDEQPRRRGSAPARTLPKDRALQNREARSDLRGQSRARARRLLPPRAAPANPDPRPVGAARAPSQQLLPEASSPFRIVGRKLNQESRHDSDSPPSAQATHGKITSTVLLIGRPSRRSRRPPWRCCNCPTQPSSTRLASRSRPAPLRSGTARNTWFHS